MLLKLAIESERPWVKKLVYFTQVPLILLLSIGGARALASLLAWLAARAAIDANAPAEV